MTGGRVPPPRLLAGIAGAALLAVVVAVASSCGISSEDSARRVDADAVPFRLLDEEVPAPSPSRPGEAAILVYLADAQALRPVLRGARADSGPLDALRALVDGPTAEELAAGLRSLLPPDTRILDVTTRGSLVVVDLDAQFASGVSAMDRARAFAQIVYTVTGFDGLSRVAFRVQGEPVDVPRGDGTLTAGPVTRADYPQPP